MLTWYNWSITLSRMTCALYYIWIEKSPSNMYDWWKRISSCIKRHQSLRIPRPFRWTKPWIIRIFQHQQREKTKVNHTFALANSLMHSIPHQYTHAIFWAPMPEYKTTNWGSTRHPVNIYILRCLVTSLGDTVQKTNFMTLDSPIFRPLFLSFLNFPGNFWNGFFLLNEQFALPKKNLCDVCISKCNQVAYFTKLVAFAFF